MGSKLDGYVKMSVQSEKTANAEMLRQKCAWYVCGRARSSWLVIDEFGEVSGREVIECSLKDYSNGIMLHERVMRSHRCD